MRVISLGASISFFVTKLHIGMYVSHHISRNIIVTGFAKTVLNGTLIKLQYKPFKKHVKLYYLTLVFIALYFSQIIL